ncbi:cache domain-containing protein [Bacillus glycinifermentans]|uniref:cache domain-containing protein n=1 Tax=Bacillus glycinifermentans TaxID=1664069 RepID=UPI003D1BC0E8
MKRVLDWIKRPSISKRLIFSFILVLTVPILVLAASSYYTASSTLKEEIMRNAKANVDELNDIINQTVGSKETDVSYFSEWINKKAYTEKGQASLKEKFEQYIKQNKDVELVYTGSKESAYTQYPNAKLPSGYNPVERDWYKQAVEKKGETIVTEPYKSASTGHMVITIAKQNDDGSGVVALDMNIDQLIESANSVSIGKRGFAFISSAEKKIRSQPENRGRNRSRIKLVRADVRQGKRYAHIQ